MQGELARGKQWRQAQRDLFVFYDELSDRLKKLLPATPGTNMTVEGTIYKVRTGQFGDILVYKQMPKDVKHIVRDKAMSLAQSIKSGITGIESVEPNSAKTISTLKELSETFGSECQGMLIEQLALECHELRVANEKLARKLTPYTADAHTKIGDKLALVTIKCDPIARDCVVEGVEYQITGRGEGQLGSNEAGLITV